MESSEIYEDSIEIKKETSSDESSEVKNFRTNKKEQNSILSNLKSKFLNLPKKIQIGKP